MTLELRLEDVSTKVVEHYNDNWVQHIGGYNGTIHTCPISDKLFFNTEGRHVRNERGQQVFVCADYVDYWECACCSEDFFDDVDSHDTQDGQVCHSCLYDNYTECAECGDHCSNDDMEYDDDDDSYNCPSCVRSRIVVVDGYHSRRNESARNSWQNRTYRDKVMFGVELEILSNRDQSALKHICDSARSLGFLAERDGSLDSNYGVEIVAPPLSIEDCSTQWKQFLDNIAGNARGWQAGTGYGMHVSFSRKTLTNLHCGKLMMFVHDNHMLC